MSNDLGISVRSVSNHFWANFFDSEIFVTRSHTKNTIARLSRYSGKGNGEGRNGIGKVSIIVAPSVSESVVL